MNVGAALETNAEAAEVMQPDMCACNDPAIFPQAAAVFGAALGDRRAVGVGDDVVLGTGARTIGRVEPRFWPARTARIDDESTAAREKSIWSAAR